MRARPRPAARLQPVERFSIAVEADSGGETCGDRGCTRPAGVRIVFVDLDGDEGVIFSCRRCAWAMISQVAYETLDLTNYDGRQP